MKKLQRCLLAITVGLCLSAGVRAQITVFSYLGQLDNNNTPASESCVFRFTLDGSPGGNNPVASPLAPVTNLVVNGVFTVVQDFGNNFDGSDRWLLVELHTNDYTNQIQTTKPTVQRHV